MRTRHARRGFLLITALMVVAGLLTLSVVSMTRSATDVLVTNRFVAQQQAFAVAEAGVDCAITQLRSSPVAAAASANCTTCTAIFPAPCAPGTRTVDVSDPDPMNNNRYPLASTGMAAASATSTVTAVLQRTAGGSPFQGIYATEAQNGYSGVKLNARAQVDSYDSRLGDYGKDLSASPDSVYGSWNKSQDSLPSSWQAEVRTNSTTNEPDTTLNKAAIYVRSSAKVYGSVAAPLTPAPGAEVENEDLTGNNILAGVFDKPIQAFSTTVAPEPPGTCDALPFDLVVDGDLDNDGIVEQPPVTYPGTSYCAPSHITVREGGVLQFPSLTTLSVTGTLTITEGSTLQAGQGTMQMTKLDMTRLTGATGPTLEGTAGQLDIYTNEFAVSGATLRGKDQLPPNLRLYQTPTPAGDLRTWYVIGSTVYGAIYALEAQLTVKGSSYLGDSSIFGAAICGYCYFSSYTTAWMHVDTALRDAGNWPAWLGGGGGSTTVTVLAQY